MNIACATTELNRIEEYRSDLAREISGHCEIHGCGTRQLEAICGLRLASRDVAAPEFESLPKSA